MVTVSMTIVTYEDGTVTGTLVGMVGKEIIVGTLTKVSVVSVKVAETEVIDRNVDEGALDDGIGTDDGIDAKT
jgi:hypothetical protein